MESAPSRRKRVALGLVGAGPWWEEAYRPAFSQQAQHLHVRSVYDAVPAKAEQIAKERAATTASSLISLFERPDIDAVVVLDSFWYGWTVLDFACQFLKPTLVVGPWGTQLAQLETVHASAREAGVLLMAAFPRRYAPSTTRLRELMATRLGRAESISAEIFWPEDQRREQLVEWIDWCASVIGQQPTVRANGSSEIRLQFPNGAAASLEWRRESSPADESSHAESVRIECQHGHALITGCREIAWQIGTEEKVENLTSDRSSAEILLNQFARRVVGGLVPVADLGDVIRSVRLAQTVWPN
jgi:predicted dehydrogenase